MTQRLRDNQALFAEGYGLACEHDSSLPDRFSERMDARKEFVGRFLDAVDRALTATGPGSGAAPGLDHARGVCDEANCRFCAAYAARHAGSSRCTNCNGEGVIGWGAGIPCEKCNGTGAATPPSGSPPTTCATCKGTRQVLHVYQRGPGDPPGNQMGPCPACSGSPPGAAEPALVFPYGPPHKKPCGCDFGRAATCGTKAEFIECGCVCHRGGPPVSPDGSRGTR